MEGRGGLTWSESTVQSAPLKCDTAVYTGHTGDGRHVLLLPKQLPVTRNSSPSARAPLSQSEGQNGYCGSQQRAQRILSALGVVVQRGEGRRVQGKTC